MLGTRAFPPGSRLEHCQGMNMMTAFFYTCDLFTGPEIFGNSSRKVTGSLVF